MGSFRPSEKEPKVRLRTLRRVLRDLREYLAITRGLPSLPTGTPAEGSIQVAGAPNDRGRMARQNPRRKTTPVPGVRAPCARARQSRAVFRLPVGAARHAKAAVPPRAHFRYGSGDSRAEALRPRRGGWRDAVGSFAHPWRGAADFGRRPTGGGAGVKGARPPAASFPHFLSVQEMGPPAGAGPGSSAAS